MNRKSQSPHSYHPFTHLRSKITLQPGMKSSQNLHDSRCQRPRLTEVRLEFKAKLTTHLATSTDKLQQPRTDKPERQEKREKNSQMYASYLPSRKDQLIITLVLAEGPKQVKFPYTNETVMSELTSNLRTLANMQHVFFRSGDLMIDHALTLDGQKVSLLKQCQPLKLRPQPILTEVMPDNSLKRFNVLKCVGSGGFSKVFLVEVYGAFLALKVIDKKPLLDDSKAVVVHNERKVLMALDHPFIAHMHYALETERYVAIALEYCCGGELFYHLRKHRRMKEADARFYFVELLSALKAMHEKGIVYRDLKPENVILDATGHVRLTDFGLSKFLSEDELTHSFCGSAEYMAPQMLTKSGHSFSIDFYCLGALLYELVTGLPPYYSTNTDALYENILKSPVEFPSETQLSANIRSLLSQLLIKDPQRRLGRNGGVSEIMAHPWLAGISMIEVLSKRLVPPIKPNILTSNFDDGDFKQGESQDMEQLRREKLEGDLREPKFGSFFFESEQMRRKREFCRQSQFNPAASMKKKTAQPRTIELAPASSQVQESTLKSSQHILGTEPEKKIEPNSNRLRNNKYYLQPYHKYGSSSPAAMDSRGSSQVLKYRLPASTKTLLHPVDRSVPSTPEGRRQYSQELSSQPFQHSTNKDYLFSEPTRQNSGNKYTSPGNLNGMGRSSERKYQWNTIHTSTAGSSTASKQPTPRVTAFNDYGSGRRTESPADLLKAKPHENDRSAKLTGQHSELKKGYFNKDKIRTYLAGVYKH